MRQSAARLGAALLLCVCAISARAQDDVKKAIDAHYQAIAAALQDKKTDALDKAALSDAKAIDLFGREQDKAKWMESLGERVAKINGLKVTAELREVKTKDDEATSIALIKAVGETAGNDGKNVPIEWNMIDRTTWAKADGNWKIKLFKTVSLQGKQNNRTIRATFTPDADMARKEFQGFYDAVADLYNKKDFDTMEKGATDDVDIRDANGEKLSGKELVKRVRDGAKNIADPVMTINVQMLEMIDGKAVVVRTMQVYGDMKIGDMNHRVRYSQIARDTWTQKKTEKGNVWQNNSSHELYSEAALDGKLVPLAQIGGK
jgi:ketosteroid isomerase-like protein